MNKTDLVETPRLRDDLPDFRPGDTLRVHVRVAEAAHGDGVYEAVVTSLAEARGAPA